MAVDDLASYVADDESDVGGDPNEATERGPDETAAKRAAGKALIAAIKSGDGLAVCEAVRAINDESY